MTEIVPRETIGKFAENPDDLIRKLEIYEHEVERWNSKINLISPKSEKEIWERHFVDSLQLNKYVPRETKTAMDVGSGGGFPALVLAAANPKIMWTLIESDQRKSVFLRSTARNMSLNVSVISERVEHQLPFKADLITARALAELDQLLTWVAPFSHANTVFLLPKGKTWQKELTRASKNWQMSIEDYPSITEEDARILRISNLERR